MQRKSRGKERESWWEGRERRRREGGVDGGELQKKRGERVERERNEDRETTNEDDERHGLRKRETCSEQAKLNHRRVERARSAWFEGKKGEREEGGGRRGRVVG